MKFLNTIFKDCDFSGFMDTGYDCQQLRSPKANREPYPSATDTVGGPASHEHRGSERYHRDVYCCRD
jgi:hypothetical protein